MAKSGKQATKKSSGGPLNARVSYLFQAAQYLSQAKSTPSEESREKDTAGDNLASSVDKKLMPNRNGANLETTAGTNVATANPPQVEHVARPSTGTAIPAVAPAFNGTTHHLITQLRAVSSKSQIKLSQDIKPATCKRCDALLIPDITCEIGVENGSKGAKKKWADVRVVKCRCGGMKRFPVGASRQKRKGLRDLKMKGEIGNAENEGVDRVGSNEV